MCLKVEVKISPPSQQRLTPVWDACERRCGMSCYCIEEPMLMRDKRGNKNESQAHVCSIPLVVENICVTKKMKLFPNSLLCSRSARAHLRRPTLLALQNFSLTSNIPYGVPHDELAEVLIPSMRNSLQPCFPCRSAPRDLSFIQSHSPRRSTEQSPSAVTRQKTLSHPILLFATSSSFSAPVFVEHHVIPNTSTVALRRSLADCERTLALSSRSKSLDSNDICRHEASPLAEGVDQRKGLLTALCFLQRDNAREISDSYRASLPRSSLFRTTPVHLATAQSTTCLT